MREQFVCLTLPGERRAKTTPSARQAVHRGLRADVQATRAWQGLESHIRVRRDWIDMDRADGT